MAELEFIGWSRYGEARPFGLMSHTHGSAYEICFIKRGTSEWWAGEETYRIRPGDIFLTKPNELHGGIDNTMHPCELFWALFRLDTEKGSFAFSERLTTDLDSVLKGLSCRQAKAPDFIEGHFLRILDTLGRKDRFSEAVVNSSMQLLLIDIVRAFKRSETVSGKESVYSERIKKTVEWIRSDVGGVPSVREMAEYAGLKPSQFRDLFRTETGFAPIEFLNSHRVRRAKELLAKTDRNITDIAIEVGFQSSQYFATCFRKLTGITPHHYRKSRREEDL